MDRPLYETDKDRVEELSIATEIATAWKCRLDRMPRKHVIDFHIMPVTGEGAWLECKRRYNDMIKYNTLAISLHKMMHGVFHAKMTSRPFVLGIRWDDGTKFAVLETLEGLPIVMDGGRRDRNDPQDIEPMIHIPTTAFEKVT